MGGSHTLLDDEVEMKTKIYLIGFRLFLVLAFAVQTVFAGSAKFYIVGMGTVPDLLTIRGAKIIEQSQIIMLEDEEDKEAWKEFIGNKEIWMVSNSARRYYGLDPDKITDENLKKKVKEVDKTRREIIEKITNAVRAGKIVSALQSGDPMMFGLTYYLEMLPEDIPTEIVPGIGVAGRDKLSQKWSLRIEPLW